MRKVSTTRKKRKQILNQKQLTIGMDLGDRFTYYCVLDPAGEVMVEDKLPTLSPQILKANFPGSESPLLPST